MLQRGTADVRQAQMQHSRVKSVPQSTICTLIERAAGVTQVSKAVADSSNGKLCVISWSTSPKTPALSKRITTGHVCLYRKEETMLMWS